MSTVTAYQVKKKALGELGLTTAGQMPEADDITRITEFYEPLLAQLAGQQIAYFGTPDAIPAEAYLSLATCLAHAAQSEFGVSDMDAQKLEVRKAQAEGLLRTLSYQGPTYQPFRMENI